MLPKLTRSRFLLLWGAGVALLVLISWKKIFEADSLQSRLNVPSERRMSNGNGGQAPGLDDKGLHNAQQLTNLGARLPNSSVVAPLPEGNGTRKQNVKNGPEQLGADSEARQSSLLISTRQGLPVADASSDVNMANLLDPEGSFLQVPQQQVPDDAAELDAQLPDDLSSSSVPSEDSPKHEGSDQAPATAEKSARSGLFNEESVQPQLRDAAPQDQEGGGNDVPEQRGDVPHSLHHPGSRNEIHAQGAPSQNTGQLVEEDGANLSRDRPHYPKSNEVNVLSGRPNNLLPPAGGDDRGSTDPARPSMARLPNKGTWSLPHRGALSKVTLSGNVGLQRQGGFIRHAMDDKRQQQQLPQTVDSNELDVLSGRPNNLLPPAGGDDRDSTMARLPNKGTWSLPHRGALSKVTLSGNVGLQRQGGFITHAMDDKRQQQQLPQTVDGIRPEKEEDFLRRMEAVQKVRHSRIRQICQSRYNLTLLDFREDRQKILSWKKHFEHAYANDDHRFIIFRVLKVGSLSWRRVMISLYEKGSVAFRRSQKMGDFPLMDYDNATFISKLEKYRKVLFVRAPFARFLSAYRDKYVELRHFPYYRPIGTKIIARYRPNATKADIATGRPSFQEFTQWVLAEEVPWGDFHWRPVFGSYHLCQISYDYIGKLETAAEDARYVFKALGIDQIETYPSTETHHSFSSSAEVLRDFYSQLSPELLPKLVARYKEEFELFDYPIPQKFSDLWVSK